MEKAKVFIVEDDGIIAMDIERRLKSFGYGVVGTEAYGDNTFHKVKKNKPDLVLMDIALRGEMDGIEVADQIRTRFNIPVVFITAFMDEEMLERAKLTLPFGYILKPFEDREVRTTIEMALYTSKIDAERRQTEEDLRIHQVELENQNEELRQAQLELQAARDKYTDLYDFAPVGYITASDKGLIIEANLTCAKMLGMERSFLVGKLFSKFIAYADQDAFYFHQKNLFETKTKQTCELILIKKDLTQFSAQLECIHIEDAEGNINQIRTAITDISERKQAEDKIKASLKEKEVLLREIHHRVKSNMQVIISLLRLQADRIKDKQYADMFKESQARIKSMSLIHEKLYQTKDFANIDFGEHVKSFLNGLFVSHGVDTNKIRLNIEIKDMLLDLENAIPCGLIINELVSNSLKHAFPRKGEGNINIILQSVTENEIELIVSDDGIGFPEDMDYKNTDTMGLQLLRVLAEHQLGGKIELKKKEGTQFNIKFKRAKYKSRI